MERNVDDKDSEDGECDKADGCKLTTDRLNTTSLVVNLLLLGMKPASIRETRRETELMHCILSLSPPPPPQSIVIGQGRTITVNGESKNFFIKRDDNNKIMVRVGVLGFKVVSLPVLSVFLFV